MPEPDSVKYLQGKEWDVLAASREAERNAFQGIANPTSVRTIGDDAIRAARVIFAANEPRGLFYRVATELIALALAEATSVSVAEALAVQLQTWNKAYYQFKPFTNNHFLDIERLLDCHRPLLAILRPRSIESFCIDDEAEVKSIFGDFEQVLGPVGAAKCQHLLAPRFFPIWDRRIANAYGLPLQYAAVIPILTSNSCESVSNKQCSLEETPASGITHLRH
jgi:hypothetical protein